MSRYAHSLKIKRSSVYGRIYLDWLSHRGKTADSTIMSLCTYFWIMVGAGVKWFFTARLRRTPVSPYMLVVGTLLIGAFGWELFMWPAKVGMIIAIFVGWMLALVLLYVLIAFVIDRLRNSRLRHKISSLADRRLKPIAEWIIFRQLVRVRYLRWLTPIVVLGLAVLVVLFVLAPWQMLILVGCWTVTGVVILGVVFCAAAISDWRRTRSRAKYYAELDKRRMRSDLFEDAPPPRPARLAAVREGARLVVSTAMTRKQGTIICPIITLVDDDESDR